MTININNNGQIIKSDIDKILEHTTIEELINQTKKLLKERAKRLKYNREYMKQYRQNNPEYKKKCVEYAIKSHQKKKKKY